MVTIVSALGSASKSLPLFFGAQFELPEKRLCRSLARLEEVNAKGLVCHEETEILVTNWQFFTSLQVLYSFALLLPCLYQLFH